MEMRPTVVLVDDDKDARDALGWGLRSLGIDVACYASPQEALESCHPNMPGCFVLDLELREMSGLELHRKLSEKGCLQPFIILSGHGDISIAVKSMREGAIDFIEKPYSRQRLFDRIQQAIALDAAARSERGHRDVIRQGISRLTQREFQVLQLIVAGKQSKQIARDLSISHKTVEVHRSNIIKKMKFESVAQLVQAISQYSVDLTTRY